MQNAFLRNRQASEQSRSRESSAKFSVGDSGIRVPRINIEMYRTIGGKSGLCHHGDTRWSFCRWRSCPGFAAHKYHDAKRGFPSKYEVDLVAFVAPNVVTSRPILEANGWRVLERASLSLLTRSRRRDYAEKVANSGCCGADEF